MNRLTDTSPDALRVQVECYRRMPVARKWQTIGDAYCAARALHATGVRLRTPDATSAMIQTDWCRVTLGPAWPQPARDVSVQVPALLDLLPAARTVVTALHR